MKSDGEIMEILAAYDLTGSLRAASELAGCSHHTVAAHVAARDAGRPIGQPAPRTKLIDQYQPHIEQWVDDSKGKIRADKAHEKLVALGFTGSERTTRRAVAKSKQAWKLGHQRIFRPWVTEPGLWLQYDFGDGPLVNGIKTVLFVAWLAFSRFRVVIPIRDQSQPNVFAALDRTFRMIGGAPTYVLTDNAKTVTVEHIAGVPVRNSAMAAFGRYYGVSVLTCEPADPATKGGVEAAVKIAKADLVPTDTNLRADYASFEELEAACVAFMDHVNHREHRVTRRRPADVLADEEQPALHRIPDRAHTVTFGVSRQVPVNTPMVTFENGQYSVPHTLIGQQVFVRAHGVGATDQIVIVHVGNQGPVEVTRHHRARPGSPSILDAHFPTAPDRKVPGEYTIRPTSGAEHEFLAIGHGAAAWLTEAAAAGAARMRTKMSEAVGLAAIHGTELVDQALGTAAAYGRFDTGDLSSLLATTATTVHTSWAGDGSSLAQGTSGWAAFGTTTADTTAGGKETAR